jgi:hypothetical protein
MPPLAGLATAEPIVVVQVTATSEWATPSPDPMDMTFDPELNRLVIVDSEVEETGLGVGKNGYLVRPNGLLRRTFNTLRYTDEPTGVARMPTTGHYFVASDGPDRTYFIKPGLDGRHFTGDDIVKEIRQRLGPFRSDPATDVEALLFADGALWMADGAGGKIYRIERGLDGRWAGHGQWDNVVTHWDTDPLGILDPEGIVYVEQTGNLLIVGNRRDSDIVEVTLDGVLVRTFEGADAGWRSPSGLAFAPAPSGVGTHLFLIDRGFDNDQYPRENDGKLFELSLDLSS